MDRSVGKEVSLARTAHEWTRIISLMSYMKPADEKIFLSGSWTTQFMVDTVNPTRIF